MHVLLMGVSGVGKSTVGRMLAEALGARFIEGDDFHPSANRAKMAAGRPLEDSDRLPWLAAIAAELERSHGEDAVLACSALAQRHRAVLIASCPEIRLVWLNGAPELIAARMAARAGHFMPVSLLDSQLAALEPPVGALMADISAAPEDIVADLMQRLKTV